MTIMKLHFQCHATLDQEEEERKSPIVIIKKKKKKNISPSLPTKLKSLLSSAVTGTSWSSSIVTGTLFGHRRGHVHFAFQLSPSKPVLIIELAMPTRTLIKEMAFGAVGIVLECDQKAVEPVTKETVWKGYCNGKKCGAGVSRECGPHVSEVLTAVGPASVGAGVLPAAKGGEIDGELIYVRARFERVVESTDSQAFYMIRPDGRSGSDLSIYLLRV